MRVEAEGLAPDKLLGTCERGLEPFLLARLSNRFEFLLRGCERSLAVLLCRNILNPQPRGKPAQKIGARVARLLPKQCLRVGVQRRCEFFERRRRCFRAHRGRLLRWSADQHIGGRIPHPRTQRRRTGIGVRRAGGDQRSQAPAEAALLT